MQFLDWQVTWTHLKCKQLGLKLSQNILNHWSQIPPFFEQQDPYSGQCGHMAFSFGRLPTIVCNCWRCLQHTYKIFKTHLLIKWLLNSMQSIIEEYHSSLLAEILFSQERFKWVWVEPFKSVNKGLRGSFEFTHRFV